MARRDFNDCQNWGGPILHSQDNWCSAIRVDFPLIHLAPNLLCLSSYSSSFFTFCFSLPRPWKLECKLCSICQLTISESKLSSSTAPPGPNFRTFEPRRLGDTGIKSKNWPHRSLWINWVAKCVPHKQIDGPNFIYPGATDQDQVKVQHQSDSLVQEDQWSERSSY